MNSPARNCHRFRFTIHVYDETSRYVLFMATFAFFIFGCEQLSVNAHAQANPDPFEQDPLPDGVISIEAEHFHTNTSVGIHYIVGRGAAGSSTDDSFHAGIDGVGNSTSDRINRRFNTLNPATVLGG